MNKIDIKHTSIVINNYEQGDSNKLENTFSVYDSLYHTRFFKGIEFIPEEKKVIIPRGVDTFWVEKLFNEYGVVDSKCDPYDKIDDVMIKYLPRDDKQKEALKFMIGIGDYKHNKHKSQLSVNLNTGVGKTYCSIAKAAYDRMRSIVITYSVNWIEQWKNFVLEYTDIMPREIYIIEGSASIKRLLKKDISQYKFILATHGTLKSYGDTNGWDKVTELFKYMRVGLKFYDECHLNFDNMCKIDFYTNTKQTIYVSATPARSDKDENIIFQYYFKNIPAIELFNEDDDPRTQYIALRYNSDPSPMDVSNCKNQYGLDRNKYTNYVVRQENFYKIIHVVIDLAMKNNGKNLFYIGTISAIDKIYRWIIENYPELYGDVGIYNSSVQNDKELQLEKKIILSTTKSCGAAMDIKGLKMVVILAEPFKSEVLARQTLGRTRDRDTFYIEVVDDGFAYTKKYYYQKKDIFIKYATKCTEIDLRGSKLDQHVNTILSSRIPVFRPLIVFYEEPKLRPLIEFYNEV